MCKVFLYHHLDFSSTCDEKQGGLQDLSSCSNNLNIVEQPSYEVRLLDYVKRLNVKIESLLEHTSAAWFDIGNLVFQASQEFPDKNLSDLCRDLWFYSDFREEFTPRTLRKWFYLVKYWVEYREWYWKKHSGLETVGEHLEHGELGGRTSEQPSLIRFISGDLGERSEESCSPRRTQLSRHISPRIILGQTLKWSFAYLIAEYNVPYRDVERILDKIEGELWGYSDLKRYLKKRYGRKGGRGLLCWFCGVELRFEDKDKDWKYEPLCAHCIEKLEEMKG